MVSINTIITTNKFMKRLFLGVIALLTFIIANAQSTEVTYKVTNYEINGVNYDNLALSGDVALSFYMCDENTLCFAIHWRNINSQSYGVVYSLKQQEIPSTRTTYRGTEITFTWNFSNSYDNITGNAAVTITNFYIGNTVMFTAEIIVPETNKVLLLKGYLE